MRFGGVPTGVAIAPADAPYTSIKSSASVSRVVPESRSGAPDASTFTPRGAHTASWTWLQVPPASFTTPFDLKNPSSYQGVLPVMAFGSSNNAWGSDASYWSRDDSSGQGFSIVAWCNPVQNGSNQVILTKDDHVTQREWEFHIDSNSKLRLGLWDKIADVEVYRLASNALTFGTWVQLAATYAGTGGGSAANGITLYINGVAIGSSANNNQSYVRMRDLAAGPVWGSQANGDYGPFVGQFAVGPAGPAFVQAELTAAQIKRDYDLVRGFLGS